MDLSKYRAYPVAQSVEPDAIRSALRLVYQTYVREHFIEPNAAEIRVNFLKFIPYTTVFTYGPTGEPTACMTLTADSELGLPSEHAFRAEIADLRLGAKLVEIGNMVNTDNPRVIFALMAAVQAALNVSTYDIAFAAISENHQTPLTRKFGFIRIAGPRIYNVDTMDTVVAVIAPCHPTSTQRESP